MKSFAAIIEIIAANERLICTLCDKKTLIYEMGCNGPLLFQHAGIEYYETTRNFKKKFMNLGAKNWSKKIMKRRLYFVGLNLGKN